VKEKPRKLTISDHVHIYKPTEIEKPRRIK